MAARQQWTRLHNRWATLPFAACPFLGVKADISQSNDDDRLANLLCLCVSLKTPKGSGITFNRELSERLLTNRRGPAERL